MPYFVPIEVVCVQDRSVIMECETHEQAQLECKRINAAERDAGSSTRVFARPGVDLRERKIGWAKRKFPDQAR